MPPSGPRSRPSHPSQPTSSSSSSSSRPSASTRNEVFENIFGRPAGGHHLGPGHSPSPAHSHSPSPAPGLGLVPQTQLGVGVPQGRGSLSNPPPSSGSGYPSYPSYTPQPQPPIPSASNAYLNPAQPSYPPGMVPFQAVPLPPPPRQSPLGYPSQQQQQHQHVYQPPSQPQQDPYANASRYDSNARYNNRSVSQGYAANHLDYGAPNNVDRRASLAPSTYSTTSSASFYSPNPDTISPQSSHTARLPNAAFPTPQPTRVPSGGQSLAPAARLTAAQAYQASTFQAYDHGYDNGSSSPASVVFPHRAAVTPSPAPAPPSDLTAAFGSTSGSSSRLPTSNSITSFHKPTSQSPPPVNARSTLQDDTKERFPPTPDYIGTMGRLSFETSPGKGFMDDLPGLGGRKESDGSVDSGGYNSQVGHQDPIARTMSQPSSSRPPVDRVALPTAPGHRRMGSDTSITSSVYTTTGRPYMTPLSQIDASPISPYENVGSPTTPTGSESGFVAHAVRRLSGRKSMESTVSLPLPGNEPPLPPGAAPSATKVDARATSFSGSSTARKEAAGSIRSGSVGHGSTGSGPPSYAMPPPLASHRSLSGVLARSPSNARAAILQSMPHIYPALLSKVAEAFKQLLTLSELVKDGITYKDSFDGRTAVGIIADIIKTPDRNLALLLGRALDAQKFFHDVTYDHRLRDNPLEIYQFKERLTAPFISENGVTDSPSSGHGRLGRALSNGSTTSRGPQALSLTHNTSDSASMQTSESQHSFSPSNTPATSATNLTSPTTTTSKAGWGDPIAVGGPTTTDDAMDSEEDLPVGVFTLLTDCYSPTCSRERLCYSINCPRRLEQMKRLNMKPQPGLSRKLSHESMHDVKETGTLWIHSVSQEILDSVDDQEKKRQEAINEVIYTERDFVRDLEYLRDSWVKPLRTQEIVDQKRRDDFVRQVFWNVHDVLGVNHVLAERLTKRQKQQPVVSAIGDLFLERVPLFEPFVTYGAHQLFGKYEFEKEKGANPAFQKFVDETERKPESRKLELNGYLTKPTTRLGRYPLLLEAVLKYTPDDHPDKKDLPEAIKTIKGFLTKVNIESGKSENIFELAQIEQQLVFRPTENIDLRLRDKNRELVHKGPLKRRGGNREEIADLLGFLFDHAFLLVKPKWVQKNEQYKVYRRPIPLELLVLVTPDDHYNSGKLSTSRNKLITRPSGSKSSTSSGAIVPPKPESKHGFSLTIIHLGKKGYQMQLWVDTYVSRKKWLESIDKQQGILRERSCVFVSDSITEGYFGGLRKINCISPYDNGNRVIYGTDEGVYFSNLQHEKLREPSKVINLLDVTQVDVIEEFQLLIVLHERCVTTFPLDCLDPNDANAALKRGKRISSHTSFIKSGTCLGKTLVAIVKSSTLSSTIKVMEPVDQSQRAGKKNQTGFMKRLNGKDEALKLFKEFYIPTESSSVHFLKTRLCVGCTKGFEIVDLETLDMQGLLDPSDGSLDFVLKRDNVRPIAIYRIEEDFLLCYDEFAFYVNKNGWRSRPKWAIVWEGIPTAFALQYPYVIAFEPTFIEVRHVETGHLVQIIPGNAIQCLFADTPPSRVNAPHLIGNSNRGIMYPPMGMGNGQNQGGFRPPQPQPPGVGPNYGKPQPYPPYGQQQQQGGYYNPAQQGQGRVRPPGAGQMGFNPQPQPIPPSQRFVRQQIIYTSDDGHVQFLKFPLPPTAAPGGAVAAPGLGMSGVRVGGGGGGMHISRPSR